MNLERALELYDAWRDRELDPATESALIEFLETDAAAAMEYEMRDEALAVLPRASRALPGLSDDLKNRLGAIGATAVPAAGRRAPAIPGWMRMAAVLLLGMAIPYAAGLSRPQAGNGGGAELATLQGRFNELEKRFEETSSEKSELQRERDRLEGRLTAIGPVADRVAELLADNATLKSRLAEISDGLDSVGGKVVNINRAMAGIGEEIQLLQKGRGSRVAVIRGDTPSQREALADLRDRHSEWATVIDPLLDAPDGQLEIGPAVVNDDSIPMPAFHQVLARGLFPDNEDNGETNEND